MKKVSRLSKATEALCSVQSAIVDGDLYRAEEQLAEASEVIAAAIARLAAISAKATLQRIAEGHATNPEWLLELARIAQ